MTEIPAGFAPHFRKSPLTDPWEPLFSRKREGGIDIGFVVREPHCNARHFLHGGMLAAMCDNAMGLSLAVALGGGAGLSIVTLNLAVDYVGGGKLGQFVQVEPRVIRPGRTIGFCDALVTADGSVIARANACFRVQNHEPNP
jgi:uncharacterized protein (TIGR00369 family)